MNSPSVLSVTICLLFTARAVSGDDFTIGYWPFDGHLQDVSGADLHAAGGTARFAAGVRGQSLEPQWNPIQINNTPALQLAEGLTLECSVYWDQQPRGYEQLVIKEREYQLRLDADREGGSFAFFVYLNGAWEPRVRGPVPEPGRWYHLRAGWNGNEISLEVNGEHTKAARRGVPAPTNNPVRIGFMSGRLDELKISNPIRHRFERLRDRMSAPEVARRFAENTFGGAAGWRGWEGLLGASVEEREGVLHASVPDATAAIASPALDVDVSCAPWVSVDVDAPGAQLATLSFVTDAGQGSVTFPVWGADRTAVVNLAGSPQWSGQLRMLALSFPDGIAREVRLGYLGIDRQPQGRPYLYARSLAPGRAVLRAAREETILATIRNLGPLATEVRATLLPPAGVTVLDQSEQELPDLAYDATELISWRVRCDEPTTGTFLLELAADGFAGHEKELSVTFTPPVQLPLADYVPPPQPVQSDYLTLMHYCPLWKEGTHYGWGQIEPWPERRPAIGWYDEGTAEVADWHIKYAREHGIDGFIYCWYRANFNPQIEQHIGHALHDGLLRARYLDQFKFAIMWENGCAKGVQSREDLLENLLPFWVKNYFTHPSYVVLDNKPLLYVWRPERVSPELGGSEATRRVFEEMREALRREGFDGLYLVGCTDTADPHLLKQMAEEGWDASSAYAVWSSDPNPPGRDGEGITTNQYAARTLGQREVWENKKQVAALPDIVTVMMGWDPRPWHGERTSSYIADADPEVFRAACQQARDVIEATPGDGLDKRIVVFDNWNEFGEGHFLEPTSGFGFRYLDAIKDVFAPHAAPCFDIIPEDVGLAPPEHVYRMRRDILGGAPTRQRNVVDNLIAWWRFEDQDEHLARDSSACEFHGFKERLESAPGVSGHAIRCAGGSLALGAHRLFWPADGITVELWCRPDGEEQSDAWMINSIGAADTGWRLGLGGGKVVWQIPKTPWSHLLSAPAPLEAGKWAHVAATYDNHTMKLYVDGEYVSQLARGGMIHPAAANVYVGSYAANHPSAFFRGLMDEVRIYDRCLTHQEIIERFDATKP